MPRTSLAPIAGRRNAAFAALQKREIGQRDYRTEQIASMRETLLSGDAEQDLAAAVRNAGGLSLFLLGNSSRASLSEAGQVAVAAAQLEWHDRVKFPDGFSQITLYEYHVIGAFFAAPALDWDKESAFLRRFILRLKQGGALNDAFEEQNDFHMFVATLAEAGEQAAWPAAGQHLGAFATLFADAPDLESYCDFGTARALGYRSQFEKHSNGSTYTDNLTSVATELLPIEVAAVGALRRRLLGDGWLPASTHPLLKDGLAFPQSRARSNVADRLEQLGRIHFGADWKPL